MQQSFFWRFAVSASERQRELRRRRHRTKKLAILHRKLAKATVSEKTGHRREDSQPHSRRGGDHRAFGTGKTLGVPDFRWVGLRSGGSRISRPVGWQRNCHLNDVMVISLRGDEPIAHPFGEDFPNPRHKKRWLKRRIVPGSWTGRLRGPARSFRPPFRRVCVLAISSTNFRQAFKSVSYSFNPFGRDRLARSFPPFRPICPRSAS